MKILAIISSHRKNGHTSKVISLLKEEMNNIALKNQEYIEFEKLFLGDHEINHCKGCRACMDRGEEYCPWKDDIPLIKSKIKDSDAVIFASPVFVGDVSSSMKALIDRLAYICHRQEFYDKCALILATTNATSLKRTIHTMGAAMYSWGFKTLGTKGFKTSSSNDSKEKLSKRYHKDISKLALKFYSGVKKRSYLKPSALSLATFKLQQKYRANPELSPPIDYYYWKEQGWTDQKRTYYIEHDARMATKFCSKILYGLFSIIF
ncbi:MAG: flavodoxin family protein [Promethearchaeota archaeon]